MLNTNVNKVYRVDPTDPNSNDIETIWTKGDTVTGAPPQCKADGTPV